MENWKESFPGLLAVDKAHLNDCLDSIEHDIRVAGIKSTVRVHHLRLDGNGQPVVKKLATTLADHIIEYCLSCREHPQKNLTRVQSAELFRLSRDLFRKPLLTQEKPDDITGEAGEILLFFLNEAILNAPQMVAKMELKTNRKDELKGSDGIHAKWDACDGIVDLYFGESKIYQNVSSAIKDALKSINTFHERELYRHEFNMVSRHFKHADDNVKKAISDLIVRGEPGPGVRINHSCLIGYDWDGFSSEPFESLAEHYQLFKARLLADSPRLERILGERFEGFSRRHLRFEIFFIPFPCVQEFRNAFNGAL